MILIRCDANTDIGAGHFFRELALAEAAIDEGIDVLMAMHRSTKTFVDLAAASGVEVMTVNSAPGTAQDAREVRSLEKRADISAIVIDGYHFDTAYYESLGRQEFILAAVDDIAHQHFPVDVVVNVNPYAHQLDYDVPSDTKLLCGVDYALLRRQFRTAREAMDEHGGPDVPQRVSQVLVTLGGGDPTNETGKALRALDRIGYEGGADVVVGPANPHRAELESMASELKADVTFYVNVQQMAELMRGQHLAICAAGGTSWELACLGVPMVQLVVADNQRGIAEWLQRKEVTKCAGWREDVGAGALADTIDSVIDTPTTRENMVGRGRELVDGRGVERFVALLSG